MLRACALLSLSFTAFVSLADVPTPPLTPRRPVTDTFHNTPVTEEYRWLEDVDSREVKEWVEAQNRRTRSVLDQFAGREAVLQRVQELMKDPSPDYFGLQVHGGLVFALKSQPPKEQAFLVTLKSPEETGSERVVVDPNQLSAAGKIAIDFYVPSRDGKLVAISLSENGSEDGSAHVYEVATGKKLPDLIPHINYPTAGGSIAWNADGSGFYYTRYPRGTERPKEDLNFYQQIYFHKLGTPTAEDAYVLGKDFPRIAEITLDTSHDGQYLLATVANGDGGEFAHYLLDPAGKWVQFTKFADGISAVVFGPKNGLYLVSRKNAPRGQILHLPPGTTDLSAAKTIVKQSAVNIEGFAIGGGGPTASLAVTATKLYVIDINGGPSQLRVFDHEGGHEEIVPTLPVSSLNQLVPYIGDEILFRNTSYTTPPAWYRYDPKGQKLTRTALYRTSPVSFDDVEVRREFATSRDGTRVPVSILMSKGARLDGTNPTLLYGYGGFGINLTPSFSATRHVWVEQGGIYAVANLRGGGEYGDAWHKQGSLTQKQNVFDDFAACARLLIEQKFTRPDHLAIEGGSNGGLLMGAELTQHPDLFRAVVGHVGLYDMLRFERYSNGVFNVTEYGSVKDPGQFSALHAYSPYHNVRNGTAYPSVFLLCGINDGRVSPADTWKMAARLQAATSSKNPVLLLTKMGSGHGLGSALSERIDQTADVFVFLFEQLGMKYRKPSAGKGP